MIVKKSGLYASLSQAILLLHIALTEATHWYLSGDWAGLESQDGFLIHGSRALVKKTRRLGSFETVDQEGSESQEEKF